MGCRPYHLMAAIQNQEEDVPRSVTARLIANGLASLTHPGASVGLCGCPMNHSGTRSSGDPFTVHCHPLAPVFIPFGHTGLRRLARPYLVSGDHPPAGEGRGSRRGCGRATFEPEPLPFNAAGAPKRPETLTSGSVDPSTILCDDLKDGGSACRRYAPPRKRPRPLKDRARSPEDELASQRAGGCGRWEERSWSRHR